MSEQEEPSRPVLETAYQPTDESRFWAERWPYTVHVLKTVQPYFREVVHGAKTFELRCDDRGYKVGDLLVLAEYDRDYTGQDCVKVVTFLLDDFIGLKPGWVAMGLRSCRPTDALLPARRMAEAGEQRG